MGTCSGALGPQGGRNEMAVETASVGTRQASGELEESGGCLCPWRGAGHFLARSWP